MANTGYLIYGQRERQVSYDNGVTWTTDLIEPNTYPDGTPVYTGELGTIGPYIAPVYDPISCP